MLLQVQQNSRIPGNTVADSMSQLRLHVAHLCLFFRPTPSWLSPSLFDARFWVGNVYRCWTPKGGPKGVLPRTAVERGGPSLLWRGEKRLRQGHGQEAWYAIVVARVVL